MSAKQDLKETEFIMDWSWIGMLKLTAKDFSTKSLEIITITKEKIKKKILLAELERP